MPTMRRAFIFVMVLGSVLTSRGAFADKPSKATGLAKEATAAYKAGDYDKAAQKFEAAYQISAHYQHLFGWAQAERRRGRCQQADRLYAQVLKDPAVSQRSARRVRTALQQPCVPTTPPEPPLAATPPPPEPAAVPAPPPPLPPVQAPESPGPGAPIATAETPRLRRNWYEDPLGHTLLGAGLISLGTGAFFFLQSQNTIEGATDQPTLDDYRDALDRGDTEYIVAWSAVGLGSALVIGGVIRYVWVDGDAPSVSVTMHSSGGQMQVVGRF